MKRLINRLFVVLLAVAMASSVMAAPGVSFSESKVKVRAGTTYVLDIMMSDFPVSEGGGVILRFDPSVIQVSGVTIDTQFWDFVNEPGSIDNTGGSVADVLFSSYKGVSGDARIATITFTAIKAGKSEIAIEESAINPFSSNGNRVTVNFNNVGVRVLPVKKQQGKKL